MGNEQALRQSMVDVMQQMDARGLNRGTSGNVSIRVDSGMLVTPSGVVPGRLTAEQMVFVDNAGNWDDQGPRPSSEWRMHLGLYLARGEVGAVVHCHSRHATILACAGREIPSVHYMVAVAGGAKVPLAPYATFGSEELAHAIAATLDGYRACLMTNHGQIAVGRTIHQALAVADEVEEQAAVYCGTLAIGGPLLLDDAEMARIGQAFMRYGQQKQG